MANKRRFAANRIIFEDTIIVNGVVEVEDNNVVAFYELTKELAHTEWIGGTIIIMRSENNLIAYKDNKILSNKEYQI